MIEIRKFKNLYDIWYCKKIYEENKIIMLKKIKKNIDNNQIICYNINVIKKEIITLNYKKEIKKKLLTNF